MSWERAEKMAEEHRKRGGVYVKLPKDGDKIVGVFLGEPTAHEVVWTGAKYEPFDLKVHDPEKRTMRVRLNFFDVAEDKLKILELSGTTFNTVLKCKEKYGLDKNAFEIERSGTGTETKYLVMIDKEIDAALREKLDGLELRDLGGQAIEGAEEDAPF